MLFLAKVACDDDLMIETRWSDFKCFNVKFYMSALVWYN